MPFPFRMSVLLLLPLVGGCGLTISQIPEVWDRKDQYSAALLEMQIKTSIFCELREGIKTARGGITIDRSYRGRNVTTEADLPFPDDWGAQIELTFSADEKTTLSPALSLKSPLPTETVFLKNQAEKIGQSYATGLGLTLSSQNYRQDKFNYFYSARELLDEAKICDTPAADLYGGSTSSPFVYAVNLGIREWVPNAVAVTQTRRSSRAAAHGEGPPLSMPGKSSDSATYDNKFTVVTSGSVNPVWNLVRIATPSQSLFDLNRTRVHELLITIGPALPIEKPSRRLITRAAVPVGLSPNAASAHLASQIGNAVAAAIRGN